MKLLIIFFLFVACVFGSHVIASGLVTPERAAIGGIAGAINTYQSFHQGQLPTDWTQLKQVYNMDILNKSLVGRQSYPLEDHYQFVTQPLPLLGVEGSQILMVRTVPLARLDEIDRQWRYLIYKSKNGEIFAIQMPEETFRKTLTKAGVTITPKAGLPAVETDKRLPGTEPTPQPNPADAAFLTQHPELDPSRKAPSATPSIRPQGATTSTPVATSIKAERLAPKEEASSSLAWLYSLAAIILGGIGFVAYRSRKR